MSARFEGFAIDRQAEVPIGVQLAWALRTRIGDGTLRAGQRLPGLRDLAQELGVNLNTVRAVYQRLEHEGLIETQQGSGTFIASTPRSPSAAGAIAASAAREAQQTGVDPREVAAALYVSAASAGRRAPQPDAAGTTQSDQRRLLRRQIAALERALGELESEYPGVAPAPARTRGRGPALLSVAELAQARTALVRRLTAAQGAIDAHLAAEAHDDERDSERDSLAAKPRREQPAARTAQRRRGTAKPRGAPKRAARGPGSARPAPATS